MIFNGQAVQGLTVYICVDAWNNDLLFRATVDDTKWFDSRRVNHEDETLTYRWQKRRSIASVSVRR